MISRGGTQPKAATERKRKWTVDQLVVAVRAATSLRQVLIAVGLKPAGGNYQQIGAKVRELGLDTSHWLGQAHLRNKKNAHAPKRDLRDILQRNVRYQSNKLRKRLLSEGLMQSACSNCSRRHWLGVPIPLELDHLDGDVTNNLITNLRLLCPNCHALTPNYRGRNIGNGSRRS